jgi:ABC-type nitrate/sulfonate/bicarbonate transport system permease component
MSARNFIRNALPPILPAVVVTAATELAVRQGWVPSFLVPAPSSVVASLFHDWPELWGATFNTANASLVGFAMSAVIGSLIAIALSSAAWVQRASYQYAVFFQTVLIFAISAVGHLVRLGSHSRCVGLYRRSSGHANTLTGLLSTDLRCAIA